MPPIPTFRRQRLPSTNIGAAPVSTRAADVAGGAIGRGLQALGGGIGDIGQALARIKGAEDKSKDISAQVEYGSILKRADEKYELLKIEDNNPDRYEEYRKIANEEARLEIDKLRYGTSRAKSLAASNFGAWSEDSLGLTRIDTAKINIKTAEIDAEKAYINNPTPENLALYEEAIKHTTVTELRDNKVEVIKAEAAKATAINMARLGDVKGAKLLIKKTNFTNPRERESILNFIDRMESADELHYEEVSADFEEKALNLFLDNELTEEMVRSFDFGVVAPELRKKVVKLKESWINKIDKQGKTDYDVAKLRELATIVDGKNPEQTNPVEINSFIGRGLTGTQASALVGRWNTATKGTGGIQAKMQSRYQATLTKLFPKIIKSANDYTRLGNAIDTFFKENPDVTVKQAEEFWSELMENPAPGWWHEFILSAEQEAEFTSKEIAANLNRVSELRQFNEFVPAINPATAVVGDTVTKRGETWILIEKGKTPQEDKWQLQ